MSKSFLTSLVLALFLVSCGGGGGGGGSDPGGGSGGGSGGGGSIPFPTVSISSDVEEAEVNTEVTLTWSSTNANSCTASGAWSGARGTNGSQSVSVPQAGTNTYTLACSNATGSASNSASVLGYRIFSGKTFDGYISGAEIFIDTNDNKIQDGDEFATTSATDGDFNLRYTNGTLISKNGTDADTLTPLTNYTLEHKLSGYTESKIISPITSLAAYFEDANNINAALGIDSTLDITITDPIPNKEDKGANSYLYEKGAQATVLALALTNIVNKGFSQTQDIATDTTFDMIAKELEAQYNNTNSRVDIEREDFLAKVVDRLSESLDTGITDANKTTVSRALSNLLPIIEVKDNAEVTVAAMSFGLNLFQEDIPKLASGTASDTVFNAYQNNILSYIATDQGVNADELAPNITAIDDTVSIDEDNEGRFNVLNNDSYLTAYEIGITITSEPSNGTITIDNGALVYQPELNYNGSDSVTYQITQGNKVSSATVNITINPINDAPELNIASTVLVNENQTEVTTVSTSDPDGDELTLRLSGTDADSFDLSSENILSFKTAPDYESKAAYSISLILTDSVEEVTKDIVIQINDLLEITAQTNIDINENTQLADYSISDAGSNNIDLAIERDYGKDFIPTNTIGNSDGSTFVLTNNLVINNGEIYQALSDIQIGNGVSLTIKAGGKLISKYVEADGSYSRPPFSSGVTFSNTYGEGVVLVSPNGGSYEEQNSVGNQNIILFNGSSFIVEGASDNKAEIRNISIVFATNNSSDDATLNIDHVYWRGGVLHPRFFYRPNQSYYIYGSVILKNSYLSFVNSVNVMELDRRNRAEDIIIEDNVFHNSGGFSLHFNSRTVGLLRIQRNLYFGEDVWRDSAPAFLSIGTVRGAAQEYPKHTDDKTKVLFKDNAILATPSSSKAISCIHDRNSDPYVPWEANYFGYTSDFENTVRKLIIDNSSDLSATCSYPNSLILLDAPRTWEVKPDFYFTEDNKIIMDVPIDYESAENKVIPFNIKVSKNDTQSEILDMQMTIIDVDESIDLLITGILNQISVFENEVFVSNFYTNDTSASLSLSGDDAEMFEINSGDTLSFKTAPDFENPTDTNNDNVYELTLIANNDSATSSIDIEVSVLNVGEESDPPTFSEFTFSTTSVDVSTEAKDITFTLRVKDESGIDINDSQYPYPYLQPNGFSTNSINTDEGKDAWKLISGDTKDGVWELTLTVPQGKASGEYYLYSGNFYDVNGIGAYCYSSSTNENGDNGCGSSIQFFTVDNGKESDPPTFSEFTFSTTSVDVSTEAKDITFTLRVKDESGIDINDSQYPYPYLQPNGFSTNSINTDEGKDAWKLISGDTKDGVWELTLTVPQGKASGEYYFYSGNFYDVNGIGAYCYSSSTNENGDNGCGSSIQFFTVDNGKESDPPTFSEFTFSTTSVDVSTEAKDITFTLRVKDESGIDINDSQYPYPYLQPNGFSTNSINTDEGKDAWKLISGDTKDGEWELTLTVPQGKASGEYYFYSGNFYDVNGIGAYCYSSSTNENGDNGCGSSIQFFTVDNDNQ